MHSASTAVGAGLRNAAVHIVGALRRLQLFTGGVICTRLLPDNSVLHCSCPLAAALVYQSLASADPGSPVFESRLFDFFTTTEKRAFASTVAGLRWRLRTFIASEQNADGTWSFFGRESGAGPDIATTASTASVLGPGASLRRYIHGHMNTGNQPGLYDLAQVLRSRAFSGIEASELMNHIACSLSGSGALPAWTLQTLASAIAESSTADVHDLTATVTRHLCAFAPATRSEKTFIVSGLLDLGIESPHYLTFLQTAMQEGTSPFYWPHEAFSDHGVGSTAVTLALTLANLSRIACRSAEIWQ